VALVLVGLAALVLNFGSALMYVLQERQLKAKRPGVFYYRMPSLQTLDRLTLVTLTVAFPFLTVGLGLGVVRAGRAWGRDLVLDPLALFSIVMWLVYAATLSGRVVGRWGGRRGIGLPTLEPLLYTHGGVEAVQHAFRVASSLDSMVLGEPQILGQVKDAFALAQACRTVGPVLHSLMSQAFAVAKRVRTNT